MNIEFRSRRGFTLIEVMIVVAIMAILAMIAYPSYLDQIRKSRRSEAKAALMEAAQRQERFFTERNTYADKLTKLNYQADTVTTERGYYEVTVTAVPSGYTLKAQPLGAQAKDLRCATFTLTHTAVKSIEGGVGTAAECWQ